ncbi:MAG: CopD family protein [Caulobacteraceae bacterium]
MTFNILLGLHIIAIIAWMAGLLYLPRLYVYHSRASVGSELDATFKVMEAKLLGVITTPAGLAVALTAGALIWWDGTHRLGWSYLTSAWMITKLVGGALLFAWHAYLWASKRAFERGRRPLSERRWRLINEAPFLIMIIVVLAATVK